MEIFRRLIGVYKDIVRMIEASILTARGANKQYLPRVST